MNPQTVWKLVKLVPFALAIALVGCGDDSSSNPVTPVVDTVPPAIPTNLSVMQAGSRLEIQWDENSEPDLAGYVLQVSLDSGETWVNVSSSLLTTASYDDVFHNRADYRVLAEDTSSNQSAYSDSAYWMISSHGGKYVADNDSQDLD